MAKGKLLQDKTEAHRIICRSKAYTIINKKLYKCIQVGVSQRCVTKEEGKRLL